MAYVYAHRRNDTGTIFYVGIGKDKYRITSKSKRNPLWLNIVNKHGYTVEITHKNLVWEEACSIEKYLILFYGRVNNSTGILSNMTDGGEGSNGYVMSEERKRAIGKKSTGNKHCLGKKHTEEFKRNHSMNQLGEKNHRFGIKMSDEQRAKISVALTGHKHSEETRRKIGLANSKSLLGKKLSDTHKENIRLSRLK